MKEGITRALRPAPYTAVTPRRGLHETPGRANNRVVRYYFPPNPCNERQASQYIYYHRAASEYGNADLLNGIQCVDLDKTKVFATVGEWLPTRSPDDTYNYGTGNYRVPTCYKIACDGRRDKRNITQAEAYGATLPDNRCCVSSDLQNPVTRAPRADNFYSDPAINMRLNVTNPYDRFAGTASYELSCPPNTTKYEVPSATDSVACLAGETSYTDAKRIQCQLNLRSDCNVTETSSSSVAPSLSLTLSPTLSQSPSNDPATTSRVVTSQRPTLTPSPTPIAQSSPVLSPTISSTPSQSEMSTATVLGAIGATAGGLLSSAAAFITPTPTAAIAASVPNAFVSGVAVGAGLVGAGLVVGAGVVVGGVVISRIAKENKQRERVSTYELKGRLHTDL